MVEICASYSWCKVTKDHAHPFPNQSINTASRNDWLSACHQASIHYEHSGYVCNIACRQCGYGLAAPSIIILTK